jgi:hypothetical protein
MEEVEAVVGQFQTLLLVEAVVVLLEVLDQ